MSGGADVALDRVWKRYDGADARPAVVDLSLEVRAGELVVLVGPSGCGKSTTLRMVAGLEDVSDGELRIGGRRMNEVAPRDRDIAMVFQSYALYPHMTVYDNMAFGLTLRKVPKADIDVRVRAAAQSLGISEYLDRKPKALSGGQRQRVAMGRAIVRQPRVFLFDEPLSNLDAQLRHEVRLEIARLHRRLGSTTLYVTHDQVEAMTLADRIALLDKGVLQQVAAPLELYQRPANRFVAQFIGSPAMNLIPGRVDGLAFVADGFRCALMRPAPGAVEAGIRPHALVVLPPEAAGACGTAEVELIEPLGPETFVHVRIAGRAVVARADADRSPRAGDRVGLAVEPADVHLFDADGRAL